MDKTFASFAFGCRANQAEIQEIERQLIAAGFTHISFARHCLAKLANKIEPTFFIINTCAVTQKAEREAKQFINQIKRKFPKTKIVVTGCAATKWKKNKMKINNADWLIENKEKKNIAQFFIKRSKNESPRSKLRSIKCHSERIRQLAVKSRNLPTCGIWKIPSGCAFRMNPPLLRRYVGVGRDDVLTQQASRNKYLSSKRLLVKIQDGCNRFCTYCIVPYLRGKPKSIPIKKIVRMINSPTPPLNIRGGLGGVIKEVILTAINTEAFGADTGENFIDLIKAIIKETKVPRVSFGSINPWSIDKEFLDLYRKLTTDNRLVHFFHIPLQSGSNKILKLMKRDYTREEFRKKIQAIKKINPFAFIATDVIVGFLDETEKDFADTYNFLKDSPISKFHIFRFSKREGTAAFYMAKKMKQVSRFATNAVVNRRFPTLRRDKSGSRNFSASWRTEIPVREPSEKIKKKRAKILSELGKIKYHKFLQKHIGLTFPALFLEKKIGDYQEGLLDNQVPVFVKTSKNLTEEIRRVKVERLKEERLLGKLV